MLQGLFATEVLDYKSGQRNLEKVGALCTHMWDYRTLHCGQEITAFGKFPTNR